MEQGLQMLFCFFADEGLGGIGEGRCRRSIVIRGKIYGNGRNTWI